MAIQSEGTDALNKDEHLEDAHAKRVVVRAQDPDSGEWVNIAAVDNGDGTYGLSTSSGGSSDIVIDTNNTTTSVLAAGATYTGTATDVLSYQQQVVEIFARPGVVAGDGSSAKASFYFEYSKDGTNWDVSVPHFIRDPSLVIPIPAITVHRYFRVKYINDGGTAAIAALGLTETAGTPTLQTAFRLTTYLYPQATKELTRTLDQGISGSDPVTLGRNVIMGKSTDDTYQNFRADGVLSGNSSTATLSAGATFTGSWFDAKGYAAYFVLIKTNVVSGTDGIAVQFSDDASTVRAVDEYTYTLDNVNVGIRYSGSVKDRYIRVVYTNGGTSQANFYLKTLLSVVPAPSPLATLTADVDDSTIGTLGRSGIFAPNASDQWGNIGRGTSGGMDVGIVQHEVPTPIKALTSFQSTQVSVGASATQVAATPLTNRKSISLKSLSSNGTNKSIFIGTTSSVTTGNGYELNPGSSLDLEIDSTVAVWAISNSGTQTLCVCEVAGVDTA